MHFGPVAMDFVPLVMDFGSLAMDFGPVAFSTQSILMMHQIDLNRKSNSIDKYVKLCLIYDKYIKYNFLVLLQFEYFDGIACQVKYHHVLVHCVIIRIKPLVHQCLSNILAPRMSALTCFNIETQSRC